MIARFNTHTIVIRRLRNTSGNKRAYMATATAMGNYQDMDIIESQKIDGVTGRTYTGYFDIDTNIVAGDRLTDQETGKQFKVLTSTKQGLNFGLQSAHLHVILEEYNN